MSLTKLIINTLISCKRSILAFVINTILIFLFYFLFFDNSALIYPFLLSGFVFLIYFAIEVYIYKNFIDKLNNSIRSPNCFFRDTNFTETQIFEGISDVHGHYLSHIEELEISIKDKEKLFLEWIHNMKTSITVIDFACDKSKISEDSIKYIDDIKEENNLLKKNLEECLNVLRLDDFARDYITVPCNLKELVSGVINSKKRDFIYKKVFPKVYIEKDILIYTDKKWCNYMLEQIIANSIKYSDEGNIEFFATVDKDQITLEIRDYGIGINEEELLRVFEPFFTGQNGRDNRAATGIGLYMVKNIADKLSHEVVINSQVGIGTSVNIIFKKQELVQF